ncbi:hypothetical protein EB796_024280 [Bugula neritina]|uniref:Uncharacterized protein n=1 Tax=Bugula neritina TaxID=10212 RepID=A0A7J7IV11_BUGNE|nr:hypothetical protein EB796_024280 [Bugula neritina]
MGLLHIKCLIFLLGATEIVGTTCDPPPSSTETTNIVGTAHEGRASVSAGESFSYTCTTRQNIEWQPICPNSVYPPNVLEEYTITCLGDNQWDYVSEGCCPTESELDYVGCFLTTADISYDYPYYYPAHIGKVCQKLGLKYAFVDDGHGATGCLSSDQFLSLDIVDAPDSCTVFRKASMTWMGDSSTADANGEDIFSIFESFYGCYEISDTSWFVDNAQYKKTGWSSMKEGDCNSFCLRMFGDKKVYTVAYNTNECYCVDSDTPHTTAAREGNGIKLQWSDCQEPCAGDGSFTSTGCGSSTHAVVQHTDAAIAYGKDENCFSLFLDHNIADHGYYKFQEGVRYCSFYGYSTTSYDDAEFKCADDYDGHLISILDSGDGDYWMTNFLKIFAEHTGISSNTDIWVGGFNPYAGGGQNFMWNDGTILFEYPENHDFEDWTGQCLYLTVTNNNAGITVKSGDCTSTATRQVMCQRPSNTRDGVRSYGCWEKHDSITSVEGSHADLPTYPPALQRVQPWVTCESVISELESNPTMFGISEGECYGNSGTGHFYMAGATSTQCKGGYGSELSYDIYESEAIPQGYIGCYDVISTGNEQKTSDDMTVTGCREICYALKTTLYKYKYAALKGTECHCFEDFPARSAADPPTSCSWYQAGGLLTSGQYLIDPDLSGDTVQYRTQCNSYDNSADCDFANGWVSYKEHCYFLSTDKKTYDEAYNTCVDGDGLLLSASKGFDEIEFIEKLIRADSAFSLSDLFYVGLYQLDADTFPSTTDYVYLDSGIITDDNNLHDDWEDQGNPPCFAWRSSDMTQFPVLCNETHRYICRKDPPDPECPANAGFTSGENCYLALEINVNFWEAAEQCSLLYGNNVGLSDSNCTECQNLVTELGKELWINPYRQTVPGTDFYSAPLLSYLSEWSDSTLDLDTDPGRCSVLTSSGRRLADCEGESLGAFCYKLKDLETYCREGSAWFADFAGNCYTYVPVTSTAEFLTACRDIGAPRAVINTREDDDWLLSFRSQSRPLSTLYDNQRAITGTFDLDGNGNLISMDGTYWSGQFHNLRSDSYLSAYVRNLWEDLDDSLMHGPYINNKEDGSDLFVAEFASNMQGVLCERSRAYHGCYSIAGESLFKVYEVDYQPNTVYQCVESCRALEYSLIAITGASCYCSNDILGTYQTDQAACMGRCANTNLAVDLCGSSTLSTAIYINISDPIYDLLASTCTDLHNEGAVLSGTYKLSLSSTIDNFYCHSGGEEYGLALTRVSSVTISASSESTDYPASNARIYGLSTWVASSDTDQWWQVVFDTPHIITAILSQEMQKF